VISTTALVRQAPVIAGGVDGSAQMLLGNNLKLSGDLSNDLLVPGTPKVVVNGQPVYAGVQDATGDSEPSNYTVTLTGGAVLRYVVRRVDPVMMPVVTAPAAPTGTRNVTLKTSGESAGDFATLRNLTLSGDAGLVAVPPGTYGDFVAKDGTGFIFGDPNATVPIVYELQSLTLSGGSTLQVAGPILLKLRQTLSVDGTVGSATHPRWLLVQVSDGGTTLKLGATLHGEIVAPNGTVTIGDTATLNGNVSADALTITIDGLLHETAP